MALWAISAHVDGELVGVVVVEPPTAPALQAAQCLEISRLCTDGHPNAASRLLGAAWGAARAMGCRRMVSYTRTDEEGTSYRAAGWVAVAMVQGRPHDTGNRRGRTLTLPGVAMTSAEIVDRIRWEIGPDALATRVRRVDGEWTSK